MNVMTPGSSSFTQRADVGEAPPRTAAPRRSALVQIDVNAISPGEFRSHMLSAGVILLRNAVSADILSPIAEEVERMMDHFDGIPAAVLQREMQSDVDPGRQSLWSEILHHGVHYNYDLVVFSRGRYSLHDPLRKSPLAELMRSAWPECKIRENHITNVRRVFPKQNIENVYSDQPLTPHVDAMFHQHNSLGVNFWLPLTTAGKDRPGLAVLPMGVEETKAYLQYNPKGYAPRAYDFASMHHFRHEKLELDELKKAGLYESFAKPQMNPGDALAFTNFTIHATNTDAAMTHPRTSIEGRVLIEPLLQSAPATLPQPQPFATSQANALRLARRIARPIRQFISRHARQRAN
jgi:Phytanoyl-CoA dioxygenase (PhyH)